MQFTSDSMIYFFSIRSLHRSPNVCISLLSSSSSLFVSDVLVAREFDVRLKFSRSFSVHNWKIIFKFLFFFLSFYLSLSLALYRSHSFCTSVSLKQCLDVHNHPIHKICFSIWIRGNCFVHTKLIKIGTKLTIYNDDTVFFSSSSSPLSMRSLLL